jgi:hypothetical protein
MNMKPILYLLIIFALFLTPALAQNHIPVIAADSKEFVGEYNYSSGFVGAVFKIIGDGKYEYYTFSDCCDPVWRESGSYTLRDNLLHFQITTKTLNKYNLFDPKQATEAYQTLYNHKGTELPARVTQTEYDMQIVRWGGRIYLLEPDRIPLFTAAVNFGVEPRQRNINRNFLTRRFFLRRGDAEKTVVGKPMLPEPWISYLHDSPIKVAVSKIEIKDNKKIYTVNKGSDDGIKVKMCLLGENTILEHRNLVMVIAVEEGSATLVSLTTSEETNYKLGETLITKPLKIHNEYHSQ